MNVFISVSTADAQESLKTAKTKTIANLELELDAIFRNKISTPEQVISVYSKLENYKQLSGKDYKITFKENTIV